MTSGQGPGPLLFFKLLTRAQGVRVSGSRVASGGRHLPAPRLPVIELRPGGAGAHGVRLGGAPVLCPLLTSLAALRFPAGKDSARAQGGQGLTAR